MTEGLKIAGIMTLFIFVVIPLVVAGLWKWLDFWADTVPRWWRERRERAELAKRRAGQ
jgi:hypothetical protein